MLRYHVELALANIRAIELALTYHNLILVAMITLTGAIIVEYLLCENACSRKRRLKGGEFLNQTLCVLV